MDSTEQDDSLGSDLTITLYRYTVKLHHNSDRTCYHQFPWSSLTLESLVKDGNFPFAFSTISFSSISVVKTETKTVYIYPHDEILFKRFSIFEHTFTPVSVDDTREGI